MWLTEESHGGVKIWLIGGKRKTEYKLENIQYARAAVENLLSLGSPFSNRV